MEFAVITGASRGLGKSFAYQLAKLKINLILVSLARENLLSFGKELEAKNSIKVHCYETDLSNTDKVLRIAKDINANFKICMLINNVGIGGSNKIMQVDTKFLIQIIQINIVATSLLTHQLIPNLIRQTKSYILNVSSLAGLSAMGYKTIYPASKAFIHSFSLSLYYELKNTNIHVGVVHPGPMVTNSNIASRYQKQGFFGKLSYKSPDMIAKRSIKKLLNRNKVIIVNPVSFFLLKILPNRFISLVMTKSIKKEL